MYKKIGYGILIFVVLICVRHTVLQNRQQIGIWIEYVTPPKYSPNNSGVSTVSRKYIPPKFSNDSEIVDFNMTVDIPPMRFKLDDTDLLRSLELTCEPESYGYSKEQGEYTFPKYEYPKCSEVNKQNDTYLKIEDGTLYMNCPGDFKGRFVVGPVSEQRIAKQEEVDDLWRTQEYSKPVVLGNKIEFALGTCVDSDSENYKQAYMIPRFNETIYKNAKSKLVGKPKIIFMLTLDSMSRRHFFRKLPKTVEFLNNMNTQGDNWVFDFKLHNILGPNSVGNQVPIFGRRDRYLEKFEGDQNVDYLGKNALWNILREYGYVSYFGLENCDNYFPRSMGRMPNIDYVVNPFYCAIYKYTDYKLDIEFKLKQRCLGAFMTHYYALNYTYNLALQNQGVNQFLYLHLNAAHEASGQHAATLDSDIPEFVGKFLKKFGETHEVTIFLHADHGMRYGDWFKDLPAYQEHKLPSLFLITNRENLKKYPNAYQALSLNTMRLTSKMDIRKTILYIAGIEENTENAVNLYKEVASKSRTCKDAGIEPLECSCTQMVLIENPDPELKAFVYRLAALVQTTINGESYASPKHAMGSFCKKVAIDKVEKIYSLQISNVEEFIRIEMSIYDNPKVRFQANIFVSSHWSDLLDYSSMKYNIQSDIFRKAPVKTRILNISRLDKYGGKCELIAIKAGLRADTCLCTDEVLEAN